MPLAIRQTFRSLYQHVTAWWLRTDRSDGERTIHTLATVLDAAAEHAWQGARARFPTRGPDDALALTGADRGIVRGRTETRDAYARRLVAWRYPQGHRVRGSSFSLLAQIAAYWGDAIVQAWTVDARRNRFVRTLAGAETVERFYSWDWDGAPSSPRWGRLWIVIEPPAGGAVRGQDDFGEGDDAWESGTIGLVGVTVDDFRTMRRISHADKRPWKPAGIRHEWLVIALSGATPTPDGTWGAWSFNDSGTQRPARDEGWRYVALQDPNEYEGDPALFASASEMPDGSTYTPGTGAFHTSITLPNGETYAGNPAVFHTSVALPDDGDDPEFS